MARIWLASAVVAASLCVAASAANASTVIGQLGTPGTLLDCPSGETDVQRAVSSGPDYSVSSPGVITQWSTLGGTTKTVQMTLLLLRPDPAMSPGRFIVAAASPTRFASAGTINAFSSGTTPQTQVRLKIQPGDRLGLRIGLTIPTSSGQCAFAVPGGIFDYDSTYDGPLSVGDSAVFGLDQPEERLNVSAVVEPDADGDGFGDETQDRCPSNAGVHAACPPAPRRQLPPPRKKRCRKKAKHRLAGPAAKHRKKRCRKKRR